jgi:hypothetical protein
LITNQREQLARAGHAATQAAGVEAPAAPDLGNSIAEAERLSSELRNLAAAAQVLAARLQMVSRSH